MEDHKNGWSFVTLFIRFYAFSNVFIKMIEVTKREAFARELKMLINKYSLENDSDTPDFILTEHLIQSLELFHQTSNMRRSWYSDDR